VGGAAVAVTIERPDTSRGARALPVRARGGGAFEAEAPALDPGPWRIRFDLRRGADRIQVERLLTVAPPCDLAAGPCTLALGGGADVRLELSPRPLRTMRELAVTAEVLRGGVPAGDAGPVTVRFEMPGMEMGENRVALRAAGAGRWTGTAVLVRCPSGRRDWAVEVSAAGGKASAPFQVSE
jgi:nitrogen fixation protein FixH